MLVESLRERQSLFLAFFLRFDTGLLIKIDNEVVSNRKIIRVSRHGNNCNLTIIITLVPQYKN